MKTNFKKKAISTIVLSFLFSFYLCAANVIYVDPTQSVNDAILLASTGDTIVLANGRYHQTININKSIVLQAENPGQAIIDGGVDQTFTWTKIKSNEWATGVSWKPQHIVMNDYSLIRMGDGLKNTEFSGGFYCSNDSVFIRSGTDINPNLAHVSLQRPGAGTAILVVASNVTIEGFRIQCHANTGIKIGAYADYCTIRNCFIIGSRQGIAQDPMRGLGHLIEYNEITNYPFYQRSRHSSNYWSLIYKNKPSNGDGIFDSETTAIMLGSKSTIVRYNIISEMMDGMQPRKQGTTNINEGMEWYNNLIYNIRDDAVEFDSNAALRMRFHHNVIANAYVHLAPSPVMIGPVLIDHNLILSTPYNDGGVNENSTMLKLHASTSWTDGYMRKTRIIHNTMVSTNTTTRLWWNKPDIGQVDCMIANNIIDVKKDLTKALPLPETNNLRSNNVNFVSKNGIWDLRLSSQSEAIDYGSIYNADFHEFSDNVPDAGAIEYGGSWNFPVIGVLWKQGVTAPLPSVIDSAMVGIVRQDIINSIDKPHSEFVKPFVFPNPTKNVLNINKGDSNIEKITIYNLSGDKVLTSSYLSTISLGSYPDGVYVVRLQDKNSKMYYSMIVKN